ncbi:histidine--tRNA ligase [Candidatus Woesearchaeota archaeon]|nr:histidine--tRNA ligase [Candidatus Woesearchaeota archaeon]
MEVLNAKGTRDYSGEEAIIRERIVKLLRSIFEMYGFSPLDGPILERYETLSAKYAGGAEILKETFRLVDQGKRDLGLRYDLTVPLARFLAMNPQTKLPFKRYQIGKVFRDGPVSSNRIREFTQCDVDIVGTRSLAADAEMLAIAYEFLTKIGIKPIIKVNNRKVLNTIIDDCGIEKESRDFVILAIDKFDKIEEKGVKEELFAKGIPPDKIIKLFKLLKSDNLKLSDEQGLIELKEVLKFAGLFGVKNIKVDYSLARGLAYYTGTVFEVYAGDVKEAITAGGRYDKMIGEFMGSGSYPAVGISFGLERVSNLVLNSKNPGVYTESKTVTTVYIIPIGIFDEAVNVLNELRKAGINSDIDLSNRGISRNLDYADKLKIPYVLFIGKQELSKNKFKLRDMRTGKEELFSIKNLIKKLTE